MSGHHSPLPGQERCPVCGHPTRKEADYFCAKCGTFFRLLYIREALDPVAAAAMTPAEIEAAFVEIGRQWGHPLQGEAHVRKCHADFG